jgi:metal-responsive CopG/Arc/MetJ family transcriptional regulator
MATVTKTQRDRLELVLPLDLLRELHIEAFDSRESRAEIAEAALRHELARRREERRRAQPA